MAILRFLLFGWLFAIVLALAWLGALFDAVEGAAPAAPASTTAPSTAFAPSTAPGGIDAGSTPTGEVDARGQDRGEGPTLPEACIRPVMEPIRFADGSTILDASALRVLATLAAEIGDAGCVIDTVGLQCRPADVEVAATGHADAAPTGAVGGNARLSFERALAVAVVLLDRGITMRSVEGVGSAEPTVTEPGGRLEATGNPADRRVELAVWCPRFQRP
ncbi:MAG: hypothetical protein AAGD35_17565 [Actinomycetota bacterium]